MSRRVMATSLATACVVLFHESHRQFSLESPYKAHPEEFKIYNPLGSSPT